MRQDALTLEEGRLEGVDYENYPWFHERHRIFPQVFGDRRHRAIIDIAAGMGIVAKRIKDHYDAEIVCNDISPTCLESLKKLGLDTVSFDLDDPGQPFPFPDQRFDAVISLATLEHIIHLDHHLQEIRRILTPDGCLYISTPNYSGLQFMLPFLFMGETFHDPLGDTLNRYEFYAHVRYFTYKTLLRFIRSFGFWPAEVYLPLPSASSMYRALYKASPIRARIFRATMSTFYHLASPRWAFHPVLCFTKEGPVDGASFPSPRKVVL